MTPQEIQFCNILRRIVVSVVLFPAPLALKLVSVPVVVMDTSALVASLARVLRIHRIYKHTVLFCLVLDKLFQLAECPH